MSTKEITKQPYIKLYTRKNDKVFMKKILYVTTREIRFSLLTGDWMGLERGSKVVFLNLGDEWYIAIDSDNEDGYLANREQNHRSGYRICSAYMVRALLSSLAPGKLKAECELSISSRFEYHGKPIYKLTKRNTL
jgi:hypothetical protein